MTEILSILPAAAFLHSVAMSGLFVAHPNPMCFAGRRMTKVLADDYEQKSKGSPLTVTGKWLWPIPPSVVEVYFRGGAYLKSKMVALVSNHSFGHWKNIIKF